MMLLAEDVAAAHEPSTDELKAWFDKNKDKFALRSRYSFRHLYFSPDKRDKSATGRREGAGENRRPTGRFEAHQAQKITNGASYRLSNRRLIR
jgi:hypothetical protein